MRVASSPAWFRGTLEQTDHGLVAGGDGWYVLNARASRWYYATGRGAFCDLEGEQNFSQVGINVQVLEPERRWRCITGRPTRRTSSSSPAMRSDHRREERPLRQWDFVHCPPNAKHTIVGAGTGPCIVVAVGARQHQDGPDWGGYTVDEVALRHGAGVEQETTVPDEAYAAVRERHGKREPTRYRDGWLPSPAAPRPR